MKYLGPVVAVGLMVVIVMVVGIYSFLPAVGAAQPSTAAPATLAAPVVVEAAAPTIDMTQIEQQMAEREAVYQSQIQQLDQALAERQGTYPAQIQQLSQQIAAAQAQLDELNGQEQTLLIQLAELERTRSERLTTYQFQLDSAQAQYIPRFAEMEQQFNEVIALLNETNAKLGR